MSHCQGQSSRQPGLRISYWTSKTIEFSIEIVFFPFNLREMTKWSTIFQSIMIEFRANLIEFFGIFNRNRSFLKHWSKIDHFQKWSTISIMVKIVAHSQKWFTDHFQKWWAKNSINRSIKKILIEVSYVGWFHWSSVISHLLIMTQTIT